MNRAYFDTSALTKLVLKEAESRAVQALLEACADRVTSGLTRVEISRAILRAAAVGRAQRAELVLARFTVLSLSAEVLERAAALPPPSLRWLDALHLASVLSVPGMLDLVTYDRRLAAAAEGFGLRVWAPGAGDLRSGR